MSEFAISCQFILIKLNLLRCSTARDLDQLRYDDDHEDDDDVDDEDDGDVDDDDIFIRPKSDHCLPLSLTD